MVKFNQDEFLAHYFKKDERVDVNADELQRMIRKFKADESKNKNELRRLELLVGFLTAKVQRLERSYDEKNNYVLDLSA